MEEKLLYQFTPSLINEFCYCEKLFWLHYNKIRLFEENEEIKIGKIEHDKREGESKNPWSKYDQIRGVKLIEFTKKKQNFEGKKMQLLIYLIRTNKKYGEIRDTNTDVLYDKVEDNSENRKKLNDLLLRMEILSSYDFPPDTILDKKCKKCSFYDYCWVV